MLVDAQGLVSDAQAITTTAVSTNTIDTTLAGNNVPAGNPMAFVITVDVAAKTSAGDETYQFQVIQSAANDLSAQDVLIQTDTGFVTRTFLVQGRRLILPIPPNLKTKRFLGLRYVTGGTGPTITVTSEWVPLTNVQNEQVYPKNYTISS